MLFEIYAYLSEDLSGEIHDCIDPSKLLKHKQGNTNLDSPDAQQLQGALTSLAGLGPCTPTKGTKMVNQIHSHQIALGGYLSYTEGMPESS